MITTPILKDIAKDINPEEWERFSQAKGCMYGCKDLRDEPIFKDYNSDGSRIVSGKLLAHLLSTHGLPPMAYIDMLASKIYKTEKAREAMREIYKQFDI